MTELTKAIPSKLQFDGWWLYHATRPFPKRLVAAKLTAAEAKT